MSAVSEHEEAFADVARRGQDIYEQQLISILEPEQNGRAVAIHVDSGEYVVSDSLPLARQEIYKRRPDGLIFSRTIGVETNEAVLGRLRAGSKS